MEKNKPQTSFINIGSSSLLVIFLTLCLSTFAVLSLSSAKNDYSFSERLAEHKKGYYEASAKAEAAAGEIDRSLSALAGEASARSDTYDEYLFDVAQEFDGAQLGGVSLSCVQEEEGLLICYQIPADSQTLDVQLAVTDYTASSVYYEVKEWKMVSAQEWKSDQSLNLMPAGEQPEEERSSR